MYVILQNFNNLHLTSFERDRFTGHQDDVSALVVTLHLEMALRLALLPLGARGEVQTGRLVRLATDVPRADDGMTIRDGKVEQAARLDVRHVVLLGDLAHELVDLGDGLDHDAPQQRLPEALGPGVRAGIHALLLHEVEEERKGPLAVGPALDAQVPPVRQRGGQRALDVLPAADVAVVHPHERAVLEGVAVILRQRALGRRPHVREDQARARLGRQPLQVLAVPRRQGRGEDARLRAQLGVRVEADAEAIAVDGSAGVLEKTKKVGGQLGLLSPPSQ